jgi:hypothetical protein
MFPGLNGWRRGLRCAGRAAGRDLRRGLVNSAEEVRHLHHEWRPFAGREQSQRRRNPRFDPPIAPAVSPKGPEMALIAVVNPQLRASPDRPTATKSSAGAGGRAPAHRTTKIVVPGFVQANGSPEAGDTKGPKQRIAIGSPNPADFMRNGKPFYVPTDFVWSIPFSGADRAQSTVGEMYLGASEIRTVRGDADKLCD